MAEHDPTAKPKTALIRYKSDRREVAKRPEPQRRVELSKLPEISRELLGAMMSPPMQAKIARASKTSLRICAGTAGVVAVVLALLVGGFYLRLMQGPISFRSVAPTIEETLNAQLSGYRFRVADAILRLNDRWGLEFRLQDVSILDSDSQEIAKAPFASLDLSFAALAGLKVAPSGIDLIGPKVLIFDLPEQGFAFSFSNVTEAAAPGPSPGAQGSQISQGEAAPAPVDASATIASLEQSGGTTVSSQLNAREVLDRLFRALHARDGASSYLRHFGIEQAEIFYVKDGQVTEWKIDGFHLNIDETSRRSAIRGELLVERGGAPWSMSFRITNRPDRQIYTVSAAVDDVVPRAIWENFSEIPGIKLFDMPVSAKVNVEIGAAGDITTASGEMRLGRGLFYAPWDSKHPAALDEGFLQVDYNGDSGVISLTPLEVAWGESRLKLGGEARRVASDGGSQWVFEIKPDGVTILPELQPGPPVSLDELDIRGRYLVADDRVILDAFRVRRDEALIEVRGQADRVTKDAAISLSGTVSPMPVTFLKAIWPPFIAHGTREWVGRNINEGQIEGGEMSVNLPHAVLAGLRQGGDVPDEAVSIRLRLSGLVIHHLKGLPPIHTVNTTAEIAGRRFIFDAPGVSHIHLPSGKSVMLSGGQFIVGDLRPRYPHGELHFKGDGEVTSALELLDHEPLGYVKAVGMKTDIVNGTVAASFSLGIPMMKEVKFKQLTLSGKARVTDIQANALPGGLTVKGGEVNFDVNEKAVEANGDVRLNGVPVSLAWQRIFDAPPDRQPRLRIAGVLNEKAREQFGLKVNHILRGDLPVALAIETRKDLPPLLSAEANLSNSELFLSSIGWRKPLGQRAVLTFDIVPSEGGHVTLDNFNLTGDGMAVAGKVRLNEKRRLAGFSFPQFSPNALTQLAITGDLSPQNILKVEAEGQSYDGRQFFRSLFSAGKLADNQPEAASDEPGLDLRVSIDTVFGHFDTTVKSVAIEARRRAGQLTYLDVSGRLNGAAPVAVRVEQKKGEPRYLLAEATDAGSAFRLVGFYPAVQGGQTSLRVNLDGAGPAEKTGRLYVQNFYITGDQVVGQVLSRVEQEAGSKRSAAQQQRARQAVQNGEVLQFDRMIVPFSVGHGQFVLHDSAINGPIIGATLRGRIDFARNAINLSGTYVPLFGLNAVLGEVPILGDIFRSRPGEGLLGITFAVQGPMSNPNVLVNPVSMVAPGFLRQIFEFDPNPPQVIPRDGGGAAQPANRPAPAAGERQGARAGGQQPVRTE